MGRLFKIALGLILIGFGLFAVFSLLSDEPIWSTLNEEDYTYNEIEYSVDEFNGLDFDFENRDFIFVNSEDDNIKVTYYSSEDDRVVVTDSGDKLTLVNEVDILFRWFSGLTYITNQELFDVYIYLPSDAAYDLLLETSNGKLEIENYTNLQTLNFDTSNGSITLTNILASSIDLDTSNGSVTLTDVQSEGLVDLYTSNGNINLTRLISDIKLKFKTSNGNLNLTDLTSPIIDGKTSNNAITAENLVSEDIILDTSNGSITLTINDAKADYAVDMSTSNGSLYYDGLKVDQNTFNTSAQKSIYLHSSNGSVTLNFNE